MILMAFLLVVLALSAACVVDDFRNGSIFDVCDEQAGVLEFPISEGWSQIDVLRTYAEIESL